MNILSWILFGLITGIIAHMLDPRSEESSIFSAILLGVGGALAGGLTANLFFGLTLSQFNLTAFLVAVLGSLLILFLGRTVRKVQ
ncbi:MAG: hypothetical protein KatS3mg089_0350 [Patescibacteria group bacterium]|nr:MAG: hypothetical protein KatS3mg089_0350 [Patescibacteria group bacterium]